MLFAALRDMLWRRRRLVIAIVSTALIFGMTLVITGLANGFRVEAKHTVDSLGVDTFVVKDPLPMEGRFQLLVSGQTEFGPRQPRYLGGRWWEDSNGNGIQDPEDHFFLCPLLPPGRPTPPDGATPLQRAATVGRTDP